MRTCGLILTGLLAALALAAEPDEGKVYKTPQEVFDAVNAASNSRDYKALINCFSPEAQKQMAAGLAAGALNQQRAAQGDDELSKKFREQFKPILEALDKHGLTYKVTRKIPLDLTPEGRRKAQREVAALIKDPGGLFVDLQKAYDRTDIRDKRNPDVKARLTDLKVEGDRARGTALFTVDGKERKQPLEFVKVGKGWRLAPEPAPAAPKPAEKDKAGEKVREKEKSGEKGGR